MPPLRKVFVSHSHKDEPLAAALREALKGIFENVEVAYSSDKEAGGGPQSGSNWLEWIHRQMLECQEALLLLTPYSIQKPWPMWEAGAVAGIALAGENPAASGAQAKPVTPIRFHVTQEDLPGPFVVTQAVDGTKEQALTKLLGDLMRRHNYATSPPAVVNAVLNAQVPPLLGKVLDWLKSAPSIVTEGTVVEWCERLDRLRTDHRSADARYLHWWIRLMYEGPSLDEADVKRWSGSWRQHAWDIRLHLRLAENYAKAGEEKEAIDQYEIATRLAPLDVFVLHKLAKAYLDDGEREGARRTIDRILTLDPDALKWNVEVAGLEGRYWKDDGRKREQEGRREQARESFRKARDAYQAAMEAEGDRIDYYMADNVGQLSLKLGDQEAARRAYERATVALESVTLERENVWSLATRATAALVLGKEDEAVKHLERVSSFSPGEDTKESIRNGLEVLRESLGKSDADYQRWLVALDG